jgi:ElaB/YqjD/DUF883 family membrane-anchored ribosome-binding protein
MGSVERGLEEVAHETVESVRKDIKALKDDVAMLRGDLRHLISSAASSGTDRLRSAKDRLRRYAEDINDRAAENLRSVYDDVYERGSRAVEMGREQVTRRPLTIVATALLVGLLLGKLDSWRR